VRTRLKLTIGLLFCCCIAIAGCAQKENLRSEVQDPGVVLSCIAVLPAEVAVDFENNISREKGEQLLKGRIVLDLLLQEYFAGKPNVRFVSGEEALDIPSTSSGDTLEGSRQVAAQLGCNAVLTTSLHRYDERVGTQMGVSDPAAVAFSFRLFETESGRVLCQGRFEERQQSLMENILNIRQVRERGLVWLTAEELLRSGLQERMQRCTFIN